MDHERLTTARIPINTKKRFKKASTRKMTYRKKQNRKHLFECFLLMSQADVVVRQLLLVISQPVS
jgi:hypothetical protein